MWSLAVMVLVASACERRITVYVDGYGPTASGVAGSGVAGASGAAGSSGVAGSSGTAGSNGSAGSSETGGSSGAGGVPAAGSAGSGAGGSSSGSSGSDDAAADGAGGSNDAGVECAADVDCPPPNRTCALSRCSSGRCENVNAPAGSRVPNVPADCRASVCDDQGHATATVLDPLNVPLSNDPCAGAQCDAFGATVMSPRAAGTACHTGVRTGTCDGAGHCFECNRSADCPPGLFCDAHHFCGSAACTDVDCGGACGPCAVGKRCLVDGDCLSFACDAATTTCVANQCLDHRQDGDETDADCGGGTCRGCALGQACLLDEDCANQACDTLTLRCISNQCADHRLDGQETDVDCGGGACGPCFVGQGCHSNFDCQAGHLCNASKVCQ
jgi:hypothetical protein